MNYRLLRKKHPKFIYRDFSYREKGNDLEIFFDFEIPPDFRFKPKVLIKKINKEKLKKIEKGVLDNLIFHLGLIEFLSYWKATCSPVIEIRAGFLNKKQIKWWKNLIMNGMGQFFYENKINFKEPNFLELTSSLIQQGSDPCKIAGVRPLQEALTSIQDTNEEVLVPIGGGKDSVVTLEALKEAKKNIRCFSLNPTKAAEKIMKIAGCKNPIIVERKIDPKLLELNRQGFLNGHTPFSAYLAFLGVFLAVIFDYKYIAVSNERSSNEGNLKYLDKIINHQWSKSFEFEKMFRDYSRKYLVKNIEYFSFLRPLYEIQIAKLFSRYPKYFSVFLSCNETYKTASGIKTPAKKWCGKCSKCLFVFTCLYSFIEEREITKIFRKNLFEDKNLLPLMLELIGEKKFKPFECIGAKKESSAAFYFALRRFEQRRVKPPILLEYFRDKIMPKYSNFKKLSKKIMNSWNNKNNLTEKFAKILKSDIKGCIGKKSSLSDTIKKTRGGN